MAFIFNYKENNGGIEDNTTINIVDPDVTLTQLFLNFVELTRIAGYATGSWEKLIKEAYAYCIKHEEAPQDYTVYDWAVDCRFEEF